MDHIDTAYMGLGQDMDKNMLDKMCLSMMMVMYNKQHLNNIWSWIYGQVKQHWGWVEKKNVAYKKNACRLQQVIW